MEIGHPVKLITDEVSINVSYVRYNFTLFGLPENLVGSFVVGHGVRDDLIGLANNVLGGKQRIEATGERIPMFDEDGNITGYQQNYSYSIVLVFVNPILQSIVRYNPELLNQALGGNNKALPTAEVLAMLTVAGIVFFIGLPKYKEFVRRTKQQTLEKFRMPEGLNNAINYLNSFVGVRYEPNVSNPARGTLNTNQVNSLLTRYLFSNNTIDFEAAKSLILLYKLAENNPNVLGTLNTKRSKEDPTEPIKKKICDEKKLIINDIPGSFILPPLTLEMIKEVILSIPKRLSLGLEELNQLKAQLKSLNSQSREYPTLYELRNKIGEEIRALEEEEKTGRQKQEKPVETITINGETGPFEKLFSSLGRKKDREHFIPGGLDQQIQTTENASKELQSIFKYILNKYSGSPTHIETGLNLSAGKRFDLIERSDSDVCFFKYVNGSEAFIVVYGHIFRSFELEKIGVGPDEETRIHQRIISLSKKVTVALGETAEEEQGQVESLTLGIISKTDNYQFVINGHLVKQYENDSHYKRNVVNNLAGLLISEGMTNLTFEGFPNKTTSLSIQKNFARTIAEKIAGVILGITTITAANVDATPFSALKAIQNKGNIHKILAFRDDIGGSNIARINIYRIEYIDGSFEYKIVVTPSNHNSAL